MTNREDVFKIVILGGGTAGWIAANLFAHHWQQKDKIKGSNKELSKNIEITLIESPNVSTVGVGEGSTPTLKRLFEMLNISEAEWMPRCNATYKLNIKFNGWSPKSGIASYSHPFPTQVDTFNTRAFMVNTRTRRMGLDTTTLPDDFLLNGVLAQLGKGPITPAHFPFKVEYGYHFDSHLLGEFLAEEGQRKGVFFKQAHVQEVTQDVTGNLKSLVTNKGEVISGDFFVDCTGFASVLMQQTLGVSFKPYKENLFNDSAVVMPTAIGHTIPVETESTALSSGWCWKIPLTQRFGNGYVYSSDFINSEQAEVEFRQHLNMLNSEASCKHLKMKVGVLSEHWSKNCIALGLSQGFIEPLEATALHLVQISTEIFIEHFEAGQFSNQHQGEYNKEISERFERIRDYIVAHYKLNTRDDSTYWLANQENEHLSESLLQLLDVWFQREDLSVEIERQNLNTHFDAVSWHCLLSGYGAYPPLHPNQPGKGDLFKEKNVEQFIQACTLNFDSHAANLRALK
ncbi:tryptophan halogenase family protein [Algibacillus agarilyticus]|uniref:tryptophan halogenase family protein n=1 Tax=Algibacillus agarilyticus TaxID=2234133 RepID=UPI000DD00F81|nr:tryptophan halogenase family protein [Algibacillus agarilyticus]